VPLIKVSEAGVFSVTVLSAVTKITPITTKVMATNRETTNFLFMSFTLFYFFKQNSFQNIHSLEFYENKPPELNKHFFVGFLG
jgi:hypothetical protein